MDYLDHMQTYFRGEKSIGYYAVPVGILLLGICVAIVRYHWENAAIRSLFYPLALLCFGALVLGAVMIFKSQATMDRLTNQWQSQPVETVEAEHARIVGVNNTWIKLKITWAVLLLAGMGIVFFVGSEWWKGLALGLLLLGTAGFVVDVIAEKRAIEYQHAMEAIMAQQ